MTEHLDDSTQQFAPLFGANNAVSGTVADSVDAAASDSIQGDEMRRRRIWPWVVIACLLVALGLPVAAVFGSSKITCCLAQRYGEIQLPAKPSRRLSA